MKNSICPVCSSQETENRFKNIGRYSIFKCNNCTHHFTLPTPIQEELDEYYKSQSIFFVGSGVDTFEKYLMNPIPFRKRYLNRVKRIKKFKSNGHLLDIGCAGGIFLDCARDNGFTVEGIEPSETGIALCNKLGIPALKGFFLELELYKQYNIVTMYDVLEHTLYVKEEVNKIHSILKPDGILIITLPNINSLLAKLYGRNWDMIGFPEHLNYFTPQSLSYLLEKSGFEVLSVKTFNGEPNYTVLVLIKGLLRALRLYPDKKIIIKDNSCFETNTKIPVSIPIWKQVLKKSLIIFRPLIFLLPIFNVGEGLEVVARRAKK